MPGMQKAPKAKSRRSEPFACISWLPSVPLVELASQRRLYRRRYEILHRAVELGDFFHDARAEVRIFGIGHHENRLDALVELTVRGSHLQLVFEIRDGADAAHDHLGLLRPH